MEVENLKREMSDYIDKLGNLITSRKRYIDELISLNRNIISCNDEIDSLAMEMKLSRRYIMLNEEKIRLLNESFKSFNALTDDIINKKILYLNSLMTDNEMNTYITILRNNLNLTMQLNTLDDWLMIGKQVPSIIKQEYNTLVEEINTLSHYLITRSDTMKELLTKKYKSIEAKNRIEYDLNNVKQLISLMYTTPLESLE